MTKPRTLFGDVTASPNGVFYNSSIPSGAARSGLSGMNNRMIKDMIKSNSTSNLNENDWLNAAPVYSRPFRTEYPADYKADPGVYFEMNRKRRQAEAGVTAQVLAAQNAAREKALVERQERRDRDQAIHEANPLYGQF